MYTKVSTDKKNNQPDSHLQSEINSHKIPPHEPQELQHDWFTSCVNSLYKNHKNLIPFLVSDPKQFDITHFPKEPSISFTPQTNSTPKTLKLQSSVPSFKYVNIKSSTPTATIDTKYLFLRYKSWLQTNKHFFHSDSERKRSSQTDFPQFNPDFIQFPTHPVNHQFSHLIDNRISYEIPISKSLKFQSPSDFTPDDANNRIRSSENRKSHSTKLIQWILDHKVSQIQSKIFSSQVQCCILGCKESVIKSNRTINNLFWSVVYSIKPQYLKFGYSPTRLKICVKHESNCKTRLVTRPLRLIKHVNARCCHCNRKANTEFYSSSSRIIPQYNDRCFVPCGRMFLPSWPFYGFDVPKNRPLNEKLSIQYENLIQSFWKHYLPFQHINRFKPSNRFEPACTNVMCQPCVEKSAFQYLVSVDSQENRLPSYQLPMNQLEQVAFRCVQCRIYSWTRFPIPVLLWQKQGFFPQNPQSVFYSNPLTNGHPCNIYSNLTEFSHKDSDDDEV